MLPNGKNHLTRIQKFTPDLHQKMSILSQEVIRESIVVNYTPTEDNQFILGWVLNETPTPMNLIQPIV